MSDILFPALVAVFVTRFLAIRFGHVAVKRRVPIVINCLIDPTLILPLVLIGMDITLQITLICPFYLFEKNALEIQTTEKLTIQSAPLACSCPPLT